MVCTASGDAVGEASLWGAKERVERQGLAENKDPIGWWGCPFSLILIEYPAAGFESIY